MVPFNDVFKKGENLIIDGLSFTQTAEPNDVLGINDLADQTMYTAILPVQVINGLSGDHFISFCKSGH